MNSRYSHPENRQRAPEGRLPRLTALQQEAAASRWPTRHKAYVNGRASLDAMFPELSEPPQQAPFQAIAENVVQLSTRQPSNEPAISVVASQPEAAVTGLDFIRQRIESVYDQEAA